MNTLEDFESYIKKEFTNSINMWNTTRAKDITTAHSILTQFYQDRIDSYVKNNDLID